MIKTFTILFVLYNVSFIEGTPKYAPEYSFNDQANGWMKLHLIPATWSDARFICKAEGAVLASPLSEQLIDAMVELASAHSVSIIFTGVHATYSKGAYASIEGVPLSKLPISWTEGQPDNYRNSESCLVMKTAGNGTMADVTCSNDVFPFICFKKKTHTMAAIEPNVCGGQDREYTFDSATNKCYKLHRRGLIWPRAYMTCMAEGGHLAVVNSEEEFAHLRDLFNRSPGSVIFSEHTEYVAIGFSDPNDGGSWRTIHDETLKEAGFERWESGEPNNATQPWGELCGVMARGNGNFYDAPCFWSLAFICEKEPEITHTNISPYQ